MRAASALTVALDSSGTSVARDVRSEAPLLVRTRSGDAGLTAMLVGGAAGPLGGDELDLCVVVEECARLEVRSVAATLAMPGPTAARSSSRTRIEVRHGGSLVWLPEPLVSVAGSDHYVDVEIEVAPDATLHWVEQVVLGRTGESSGRLKLRHRVRVAGELVLDQEVSAGSDAMRGPGGNGPWRVITTAVTTAHVEARAGIGPSARWALMPLDTTLALFVALTDDCATATSVLAATKFEHQ